MNLALLISLLLWLECKSQQNKSVVFFQKASPSVKEKILLMILVVNQTTQTLVHADEAALDLSENTSFSLASLFHLLKKAVKKVSCSLLRLRRRPRRRPSKIRWAKYLQIKGLLMYYAIHQVKDIDYYLRKQEGLRTTGDEGNEMKI